MMITSVVSAKSELDQILPPLDAIKHSLSQHPTVRSAISDQDYANFSGQGLKLDNLGPCAQVCSFETVTPR
jgi:hypothetical protein